MSQPVAVRNTGRVEQYVIVDGRRHALSPHQIRVLEEPIARAFLERCSPHVVRETGINSVEDDRPRGDLVYLYNLSGNPDLPAQIEVVDVQKGLSVRRMIDNPLRTGTPVFRELSGSETPTVVKGENTTRRNPPRRITIFPWTRKGFEKGEAQWMLNREAGRSATQRSLARSRPPSGFEPNDSWSLNDLIAYAHIVDPKCPLVATEEKIIALFSAGSTKLADAVGFEVKGKGLDRITDEASQLMLQRLFFRVANPDYRLPSREDFEQVRDSTLAELSDSIPAAAQNVTAGDSPSSPAVTTPARRLTLRERREAALKEKNQTGALRGKPTHAPNT